MAAVPASPPVRFATARLSTGLSLHYAEQGGRDGEPLLLLHGWPDSWFTFSRVMALLPPTLRVIVPDQRGFGDSGKPAHGYTIPDFAADAVALLDAVGVERATVVGHSFGSFVARRVALSHPERVARLVLIGTAVSAISPATREAQAALRDLPDPVPMAFARDFQASTAFAPLPPPFFEQIVRESMKMPAHVWHATLDALLAYDDAAELSRLTMPTMLLWGAHDALFDRRNQDRLLEAIPGVRLEVYDDAGHCPNWERPERVAENLQAFLQSTPAR
jgi:pimeloyl-ACP methyl ester carboxylesterase